MKLEIIVSVMVAHVVALLVKWGVAVEAHRFSMREHDRLSHPALTSYGVLVSVMRC